MKKRIFSFWMAVAMVFSILPVPALAAEGCANHPVHDESCGYVAAVEGQACGHQHSDACRVETVNCTHVHTAECYPEGNMEGEPALCGHVCSVDSGCATVSCNHVHNAECGYVEAVAGQPCGHSCDLCNPPEEPEEKIVCICDTRCNEMVNTDCPVCAVDASQCAVPEEHEIPQAVLAVQAMIDALPSLEEVQAMTDKGNAYNQTQAAYEAYLALTEEEQAQVTGAEIFEALFTYFNEQIMMLSEDTGDFVVTGGTYGVDYTYDSTQDSLYILTSTKLTISTGGNPTSGMIRGLVTGITYNLEFDNLNMAGTQNDSHVSLYGSAKLTITGINKIDVTGNGFAVSNLTITSDSTGSLDIKGTNFPLYITGYMVSDVYLYVNGGSLVYNNDEDPCEMMFTSGTGTINGKKYPGAAKVGDVTYSSLTDAVAACPENGTITLLGDVTAMNFTLDKSVTLDIGGFTLTLEDDPGIEVAAGVTLTIDQSTHGGSIARSSHGTGCLVVFGSLVMKGNFGAQIVVRDGGTIEGGSFKEVPDVPENYVVLNTGGAEYPYQVKPAVAKVTAERKSTSFATLDDALAAAKPGETVVLLDNVTVSEITLDGINLNLGSFTLTATVWVKGAVTIETGTGKIVSPMPNTAPVNVYGGTLRVTGNGLDCCVSAQENSIIEDGAFEADVNNWGTIKNGKFTGVSNAGTIEDGCFSGYVRGTGTIKGGRFATDPRKENTIAEGSVVVETGDEDYPWQVVPTVGPFVVTGGELNTDYQLDPDNTLRILTSTPLTISMADGHAVTQIYAPDNPTGTVNLTLNGVNITGPADCTALVCSQTLNLTLAENSVNTLTGGTTTFNCFSCGVAAENLTISGAGVLTACGGEGAGTSCGIWSMNAATISGGTITAEGKEAKDSYGIRCNSITINGGSGTAKTTAANASPKRAMSSAPTMGANVAARGVNTDAAMSWEPATWALTVTAPTFDAVNFGYDWPEAKAITIVNSGNSDAFIASVAVDAPAEASVKDPFAIDSGDITTVPAGGTNTNYTIQPRADLDVGEYRATITVTYKKNIGAPDTENLTATAEVTFTVTREPVTYLDANGNQQTCTNYTPVTEDMTSFGVAGKETWYVVDHDVTFPDRGSSDSLYTYGDVHLILKDGCTMDGACGIQTNSGSLTFYAQSTGASMGKYVSLGTPPGSLWVSGTGSLTVNGGFIYSYADNNSLVQGVEVDDMGIVTINGGVLTANATLPNIPAIGTQLSTSKIHIRVYGGEVIAVSSDGNAIGSRQKNGCAEIYISGNAKVTDGNGQFPGVSDATSRFIGVKSIALPSTLTLDIGSSEILTPTMFPAVATDIFWSSDNESVATVDASGRVTAVSAGTANITVTGQVEKNGAVKTATCAVTVNKLDSNLPLTVKNGSVETSTFTYGDTITVEFTPAVKAATRLTAHAINEAALFLGTTQLTEAVTADASGKFTLTYNTADKGLAIGENLLTVQYGGSDKLNAGTADVTVTLNPKPVTVSGVTAVSRDYVPGNTAVTLDLNNATVVGKVGTDDVTVSGGTGTMADANAGNNKAVAVAGITLGGTHAGFYSLTAQPADVTVTITPKEVTTPTVTVTPDSYVYTGSPITPTSVVVKDGETVIPDTEYTVAYANNTNVGTATVTITDNEGGNYAVSGSATFEITTSGTNGGVTLDHANKTYIYGESVGVTVTVQPTGEAPSLLTALANLLTGNDNTISIYQGNTCLAGPTEVVDGKAVFTLDSAALGVGTWNLEARFSGSDNMAANTQPFQVIVNQKELTVTGVKPVERDYEPNNMTVALNLDDAELVGLVGADEVTVTGGTGTISTDSAAVNKPVTVTGLTLGGKDAGNYTLKQPEGLLVTIKQVTVTITANDATAKTGEEKPTTFGYTVDGLLGQDQLTTPPTFTCDADMSKAGTYDIVPGGAEVNSNYTLSYVNGTLTVQQSTTPIVPGDTVRYIVEHYKGDTLAEKEVLGGKIGETVTAVDKNYEGYRVNLDKSTMSGTLVKLEKPEDIVILKVYYDLKVNGVSLNKTTLTLTEGNTETLTASVTPAGAVNKAVTWFSSNTDVATVDANGKVTAVKEGKTAITVTTADGGFKAECEVTVKPAAYTVTFDSNGGSAVAAQTVENGRKASKPADPTLAKHNFKGWYTDEECTKAYDFDTPVTGNLTLHAKWAEVYTFTLNYKANTSATVRNMPKDESVTSERNEMTFRLSYSKPKRSGYTFTGWNTQANGKGTKYQPGDDVPGIKDGTVTLYAQWKQNSGSWWDNPKTGDYIMIAVAVLAVSGVALAGLLVYAKKKKK